MNIDSDKPGGIKKLAVTLRQQGQNEEAIRVLRAGLKKNSKDEDIAGYLSSIDDQVGIQFVKVRVENTNACRYKCDMCPREKMNRSTGIMPPDDYRFFLDRMEEYIEETNIPTPYRGMFFLHGYGEPLLDPKLAEKSAMVADRFPSAEPHFNTTLGSGGGNRILKLSLPKGNSSVLLSASMGFRRKRTTKSILVEIFG